MFADFVEHKNSNGDDMKKINFVVFAIIVVFAFASCDKLLGTKKKQTDSAKLLGKWQEEKNVETLTFNLNGTCVAFKSNGRKMTGKYTLTSKKIEFILSDVKKWQGEMRKDWKFSSNFSFQGENLVIDGPEGKAKYKKLK